MALSYLSSLMSYRCLINTLLSILTGFFPPPWGPYMSSAPVPLLMSAPLPACPLPGAFPSPTYSLSWPHVRMLWPFKIWMRFLTCHHSWEPLTGVWCLCSSRSIRLEGFEVLAASVKGICNPDLVKLCFKTWVTSPILLSLGPAGCPSALISCGPSIYPYFIWHLLPFTLFCKLLFMLALLFVYPDPQRAGHLQKYKTSQSMLSLICSQAPPCWLIRKVFW